MLVANLFAIRKTSSDLHTKVFDTLRNAGIAEFSKEGGQKIIFASKEERIVARVACELPSVKTIREELDVAKGSRIKFLLTLPTEVVRAYPSERNREFMRLNNRMPSYRESHTTVFYEADSPEYKEYVLGLLGRNGLTDISIDSLLYHAPVYVSKKNRVVHCCDVVATATISDFEVFSTAWFNGVGRLKTYGFGMIRAVAI
ncbi:hypothetical protein [Acinetobacter sp. P1(2025)]|uniref:hypothetical protein n=1 Tax=Acinetobacter sp. P1(2025) TaxID=3446120 RepID=UPI003F529F25